MLTEISYSKRKFWDIKFSMIEFRSNIVFSLKVRDKKSKKSWEKNYNSSLCNDLILYLLELMNFENFKSYFLDKLYQ